MFQLQSLIPMLFYSQLKQKRQNSWFEKTAKELEIELDEDQLYPSHSLVLIRIFRSTVSH